MCVVCARELASIFQSAKAATLRGSSSAAKPGTRPSLHPHPHPHPPRSPPPEPRSAISAASARKARRADSVRTAAVWSRGGEEQERAPQRLPGRLSGKSRQISPIFGQLWFTRTPGTRPSPLSPHDRWRKKEAVSARRLAPGHSDARQYGAVRSLPHAAFPKIFANFRQPGG